MGSPPDQSRPNEFRQAVVVWRVGLQRIERDDFEVMPFAEREEGILRAASRVDAAKCGANPSAFCDELNAAIEIAAAEKDVVEHTGDLIACRHEFGSQREAGRGSEKESA